MGFLELAVLGYICASVGAVVGYMAAVLCFAARKGDEK